MYKETIKIDNTKNKDYSVVVTEPAPQKQRGPKPEGQDRKSRRQQKKEARTSKWHEKRALRRKKRIRALVILVVILFLLFMAAYFFFEIKRVRVIGNKFYDDAVISEMVLSDRYSWNSLYVYLTNKFLPSEKVPFIDSVEIGLKSPGTIEIHVYEKPAIGCIYVDGTGQYAYFDKDGIVCELSSDLVDNVPQIYGISCFETDLYDELELSDRSVLKTLLLLVVDLDKYSIPADDITFQGSGIILKYGEITANLGTSDKLTEKLMRLHKILPQLDGMRGTLHLETWSQESPDIVFKKEND